MPQCPTCKEWYFSSTHKCAPQFMCGTEPGDLEHMIYAHNSESAAEKYAEWYDCEGGEYHIVRGNDQTVYVKDERNNTIEKFCCSGESVPTYRANKEEDWKLCDVCKGHGKIKIENKDHEIPPTDETCEQCGGTGGTIRE